MSAFHRTRAEKQAARAFRSETELEPTSGLETDFGGQRWEGAAPSPVATALIFLGSSTSIATFYVNFSVIRAGLLGAAARAASIAASAAAAAAAAAARAVVGEGSRDRNLSPNRGFFFFFSRSYNYYVARLNRVDPTHLASSHGRSDDQKLHLR